MSIDTFAAPAPNDDIRQAVHQQYENRARDEHFRAWEEEVSPNAVENYRNSFDSNEDDFSMWEKEVAPEPAGDTGRLASVTTPEKAQPVEAPRIYDVAEISHATKSITVMRAHARGLIQPDSARDDYALAR